MRITVRPQDDAGTELGTDRERRRALMSYTGALIRTRGVGRFADNSAAIILARETDAPQALAALKLAGIRALMSECWAQAWRSFVNAAKSLDGPPSGTFGRRARWFRKLRSTPDNHQSSLIARRGPELSRAAIVDPTTRTSDAGALAKLRFRIVSERIRLNPSLRRLRHGNESARR